MQKLIFGLAIFFILILNITGILHFGFWATALFLVFVLVSAWQRSWTFFHCSLFFLLLSISRFIAPQFVYQFPALLLLFIFLISTLLILPFKATRATFSWLRLGKIGSTSVGLMFLTSFFAAIALLLWAHWTDNLGLAAEMVSGLKKHPKWLILLVGIPLFAILNAFIEEVIYRGMLQEMLQQILKNRIFIFILQATAFAALHFGGGFPNGTVGYLMVLVYGIMLGYLRDRTQGLLVPILTHIFADLTIFYFMAIKFL